MAKMIPAEWIRLFHRWSGLALILFVGLKIVTGFTSTGAFRLFSEETAIRLHAALWTDIPLVLLFVFHSSYGILKMAMARGIRNKPRALALTNIAAGLISAVVLYFRVR
jgi:succinate dehydrogenase/fumarate reductase cytochrome b subunit